MDPRQCLVDIQGHLRRGELPEAYAALENYKAWRRGRGYEPPGGDALAGRLERRLRRAARERRKRNDDEGPGEGSGPTLLADALRELADSEGRPWLRVLRPRPSPPAAG